MRQQPLQVRQSVERASLQPAAYLHHLPRWLIPVLVAVLFVGGIATRLGFRRPGSRHRP